LNFLFSRDTQIHNGKTLKAIRQAWEAQHGVERNDQTQNSQPVETLGEDTHQGPKRSINWFRFIKLGFALAFLAAAAYFFNEQVLTSTSLAGTVTSPLITLRSPIDGIVTVTANATTIGAHVNQHTPLFVIESHQFDNRLRVELEAKLVAYEQQIHVIERKIEELSTVRNQLQARRNTHWEATRARIAHDISQTTAQLSSAKAVHERRQIELARAKNLSTDGSVSKAALDDTVLASQQAHFDIERLTALLKRLNVDHAAAKQGILLGEGYSDAPYSQQRSDEIAVRVIELHAERQNLENTRQEHAQRLGEEQQREDTFRRHVMHSPIDGTVWNVYIASGAVVAHNAPLADVVDCNRSFVEALIPESRYDNMQIGEKVHVKLLGNSRTIAGTIHSVRGQSAVVNPDSHAARLMPRRSTDAMIVSVAIDPASLHQVSRGVCQIGRSAKVYFDEQRHGGFVSQSFAYLRDFVSSAFAAMVPSPH
jgi:multidrug resistance efflux pump